LLYQNNGEKILIKSIEQEIQNKFLQPKVKILQTNTSVKSLDQLKPMNIRDLLKQF